MVFFGARFEIVYFIPVRKTPHAINLDPSASIRAVRIIFLGLKFFVKKEGFLKDIYKSIC